jgi:hypothetical protein
VPDEIQSHHDALDSLWAAADGLTPAPPPGYERCQKRFPDDRSWHWARLTAVGEERVLSPEALAWLDRRWAIVVRVFQSFAELEPRLRPAGADREPRGVEPGEWSCIGLHRLWDGWADAEGVVRADLRPALISTHPDEHVEAELAEYELFYSRARVVALAETLRRERGDDWTVALEGFVARQGLTASQSPQDVLSALRAAGLGRRAGATVHLTLGGVERDASVAEFQRAARHALGAPR